MNGLSKQLAKKIIFSVGGSGQPPEYGYQFFTAGLDGFLDVINREYLMDFIKDGGAAFKMVVGVYGGGKTHFLLKIRDHAWKCNFVTANVSLSLNNTPFSKLDLVYKDVIKNIVPPLTEEELLSSFERGIEAFIKRWFVAKCQEFKSNGYDDRQSESEVDQFLGEIRGVESISFLKSFQNAVRCLVNEDEDSFSKICQWIKGEGFTPDLKRFGILQKIDKTTAFEMIRSLSQLIRQIGFSGLIVSFDEAELQSSMSTRERESLLSNLRQVIDECARLSSFQGVMFFYAVPDKNFLEGRTQIYEALNQRLKPIFNVNNPSGVTINLESIILEPIEFLLEIGKKLSSVYQVAYDYSFQDEDLLKEIITTVANESYNQRFMDTGYIRLFVQNVIAAFDSYRTSKVIPIKTS